MLYQIAPGSRFALHAHPFPELGLILSGAGIVLVDGDERSAVAGDSYYFPATVRHGSSFRRTASRSSCWTSPRPSGTAPVFPSRR